MFNSKNGADHTALIAMLRSLLEMLPDQALRTVIGYGANCILSPDQLVELILGSKKVQVVEKILSELAPTMEPNDLANMMDLTLFLESQEDEALAEAIEDKQSVFENWRSDQTIDIEMLSIQDYVEAIYDRGELNDLLTEIARWV